MGRGGSRKGAGRPPAPVGQEKKENYTIRVYEHEKPKIKGFLKELREQDNKRLKLDNKE